MRNAIYGHLMITYELMDADDDFGLPLALIFCLMKDFPSLWLELQLLM